MVGPNSSSKLQVLVTWPFLISLSILLLNDLYLKAACHNWITGKLSDFSGLFMVTMLFYALLPRYRWLIGLIIASLFAVWKSPLSDPAIKFLQSQGIPYFGRVVDYSDVTAILMIPLAMAVTDNVKEAKITSSIRRAFTIPIVLLCLFAIMGTSVVQMRHEYVIRAADEAPCPDPEEVMESVDKIAKSQGLTPDLSAPTPGIVYRSNTEVRQYSGGGITLFCRVDDHGSAEFFVFGMPSGLFFGSYPEKKMEQLKKALMSELGGRFKNMEFVVPLNKQ